MTPDRILLSLLHDVARVGTVPDDQLYPWDQWLMDTLSRGVPYKPAVWFGPLTPKQRTACTRATRVLLTHRLVSRITEPNRDRVRFLTLTPDGVRHGLALAGPEFDTAAFWHGLHRTAWGRDLVDGIDPVALAFSSTELEKLLNPDGPHNNGETS